MQHRTSLTLILGFLLFFVAGANNASALSLKNFKFKPDFTYSVIVGFGNSTIQKDVEVQGQIRDVSYSEGPGMIGFSIETFIHEKWTLSLSHTRGVRLGPFSSGVGLTGLTARRYFMREPPFLPKKDLETNLVIKRWAPFAGVSSGIAIGKAVRDDELVREVEGSGLYFGLNLGVDYHWSKNIILRPEFHYYTTIFDDSRLPATITDLGLLLGIRFRL